MRPLVFLDTETTGLDPEFHEIIEICMVKHDPKIAGSIECPERCSQLYELIMPEWPERISPQAAEVNGFDITEWESKGAIEFSECADNIVSYMEGCTIVGFNPWFDIRFILSELSRVGHEKPNFNYHALDISSMAYPLKAGEFINSVSAKSICEFFDIGYEGAHRACNDVELAIECYRQLLEYYKSDTWRYANSGR
jgi:DNA polymerase-3 subunit epsilon